MEPQAQLQIAQAARRPTHPQHPHLHQVRPTGLAVSQMPPPEPEQRRSPSRAEPQAQPQIAQAARRPMHRPMHPQQGPVSQMTPPEPEPQRSQMWPQLRHHWKLPLHQTPPVLGPRRSPSHVEPQAQLQIAQAARRPTHPQQVVVSQMPPPEPEQRRSPSRVEPQAQPQIAQAARRPMHPQQVVVSQMPPPEPEQRRSPSHVEPQAQLQIAQVARRPTHPQHPHLHQVRPTGLVVTQMPPPVLGLRRSPSRVELQAQPQSLQRAHPEHCQQARLHEVPTMKLAACQMLPVPEPQRGLSVAESRTQSNL